MQRLAASLVVVARHNGLAARRRRRRGRGHARRRTGQRIAHYATAPQLEIWYESIYVDQLLEFFEGKQRQRVSKLIDKQGKQRNNRGAFEKLTKMVDGRRRIMEDPPKLTHFDDPHRLEVVREVLEKYVSTIQDDRRHCLGNFSYVDTARQVVGVGSVGMRVHLILLEGRDGDPLFLQVKQAVPSVYEAHLKREPVPQPRRPGRQRQAAHPERDRHLRRLDVAGGDGLLRAPVPRHEDDPGQRAHRARTREVRDRVR